MVSLYDTKKEGDINNAMKYTITEAAKELEMSYQYVRRVVKDGKVPYEKVGNVYILDDESLLTIKNRTWKDEDNGNTSNDCR